MQYKKNNKILFSISLAVFVFILNLVFFTSCSNDSDSSNISYIEGIESTRIETVKVYKVVDYYLREYGSINNGSYTKYNDGIDYVPSFTAVYLYESPEDFEHKSAFKGCKLNRKYDIIEYSKKDKSNKMVVPTTIIDINPPACLWSKTLNKKLLLEKIYELAKTYNPIVKEENDTYVITYFTIKQHYGSPASDLITQTTIKVQKSGIIIHYE